MIVPIGYEISGIFWAGSVCALKKHESFAASAASSSGTMTNKKKKSEKVSFNQLKSKKVDISPFNLNLV